MTRIESAIETYRNTLDSIVSGIDPATISTDGISQTRNALLKLKSDTDTSARELDQPQADVAAQVTQLGPPPQDGTPEAPTIAQQRKALNDKAAQLSGASQAA